MMASKGTIAEAVEIICGSDFYRPVHELIYQVICDLSARSEPADPMTVAAELVKRKKLGEIGGPAYLAALVQSASRGKDPAAGRAPSRHFGHLRVLDPQQRCRDRSCGRRPAADGQAVALSRLGQVLENSAFDNHDLAALRKHRAAITDEPMPRVAVSRNGAGRTGLQAAYGPEELLSAWRRKA